VFGSVLLDQIGFENERMRLTRDDDGVKSRGLLHQRQRPGTRELIEGDIASDARPEPFRLSDVQHRAVRVTPEIDPRRVRQMRNFFENGIRYGCHASNYTRQRVTRLSVRLMTASHPREQRARFRNSHGQGESAIDHAELTENRCREPEPMQRRCLVSDQKSCASRYGGRQPDQPNELPRQTGVADTSIEPRVQQKELDPAGDSRLRGEPGSSPASVDAQPVWKWNSEQISQPSREQHTYDRKPQWRPRVVKCVVRRRVQSAKRARQQSYGGAGENTPREDRIGFGESTALEKNA